MRKLAAVTAALGLLATLVVVVPGRAQDRPAPDAATSAGATPEQMIEHVLTHFAKADKGLRVGMKARDAKKVFADGAHVVGTHVFSLDATPYGLPGAKGTVYLYSVSDEPDEVIDEMHVALLCGDLSGEDRITLGAKVVAVGKRLGFHVEEDEEEPNLWYGSRKDSERCFYVSLAGKGVILFELSQS